MPNKLSFVLLSLALASTARGQAGDDCANAVLVSPGSVAATTIGYSPSSEPWNPWTPPHADRWFSFTPSQSGPITVSACNQTAAVDTVVAIYAGSCGQLVYVAGDDDTCGHFGVGAVVNTILNGGMTYYIRVGTHGMSGNFTLSVGGGSGSLAPVASGGCGNVGLEFSGNLSIASTLTVSTVNTAGLALVGAGVTSPGQPFCGCTVGHDWSAVMNGSSLQIWIPPIPSLVGFQFYVQGADLVSLNSCPSTGLSMSTTYRATVGS